MMPIVYVYCSHTGGIYFDNHYDERHLEFCEVCGDSDMFKGVASSASELRKLLHGYDEGYIEDKIKESEEDYFE
ncbi:hypothetical protein [Staphylococcus felis]|nr:hypothetical protein [Staphylococcus felis]